MPSIKIPELPVAASIRGTDLLIVDQATVTSKITLDDFVNKMGLLKASNVPNVSSDLSSPAIDKGSSLVTFTSGVANTISRSIADKLKENLTVRDFGAKGDGSTDDSNAFNKMQQSLGYIKVPAGGFVVKVLTVRTPIEFQSGAYLLAPSTSAIQIAGSISSPKQWIFRGEGSYILGEALPTYASGSDNREVSIGWFGVFPSSTGTTDQAPAIQKAIAATSSLKSAIVFDVGTYRIDSALTLPVNASLVGAGNGRTVFKTAVDYFDVITITGAECTVQGISFQAEGFTSPRSGHWITVTQDHCTIKDVKVGYTRESILITANDTLVDGVENNMAFDLGLGAYIIVVGGFNNTIRNIKSTAPADYSGDAAILVTGAYGDVLNLLIDNVVVSQAMSLVQIRSGLSIMSGIKITNARYSATTGTKPDAAILISGGNGTISNVEIDNLYVRNYVKFGVLVECTRSGATVSHITLGSAHILGADTAGARIIRSGGTLSDVYVSGMFDAKAAGIPVDVVGTTSRVVVDPGAMYTASPALCWDRVVQDDGAVGVDLGRSVTVGMVLITGGPNIYGIFSVRAAPSPGVTAMNKTDNFSTATTTLTGTTGTDGQITLGVTDRVLYIENRSGAAVRFSVALLAGIPS